MPSKILKIIFVIFQKAFIIFVLENTLKVVIFLIISGLDKIAKFYPKEDTIQEI